MTQVTYFSDFIRQHRHELPDTDGISSFVNQIISLVNQVNSDCRLGNYSKWVDPLLKPSAHGVTFSRQEAFDCISSMCEEKDKIISLTRLFAEEVAHYDKVFG